MQVDKRKFHQRRDAPMDPDGSLSRRSKRRLRSHNNTTRPDEPPSFGVKLLLSLLFICFLVPPLAAFSSAVPQLYVSETPPTVEMQSAYIAEQSSSGSLTFASPYPITTLLLGILYLSMLSWLLYRARGWRSPEPRLPRKSEKREKSVVHD